MANICFGCLDVADIEKCPQKDCVHYPNRNEHLSMATKENDENDRKIKRRFRYTIGA